MIHEQINKRYEELISSRNQTHGLHYDEALIYPVMDGDSYVENSDLAAYCDSLNEKSRIYVQGLHKFETNLLPALCQRVASDFGAGKAIPDVHSTIPEATTGLYAQEKKELKRYGVTRVTYEQAVLLQFIRKIATNKSTCNKKDDWYLSLLSPIQDAFSKLEDYKGFGQVMRMVKRKCRQLGVERFPATLFQQGDSAIPDSINENSKQKLKELFNDFDFYQGSVLSGISLALDNLDSHFLGIRGKNNDPKFVIGCGTRILEAFTNRVRLTQQWREEVLEGLEKFVTELGDQLFGKSGVAKRIFDDYNIFGLIKSLGLEATYREVLDKARVFKSGQ